MANVYAVASGNWSNTAIWNTGSLPTSADVVYANNFNVNVDTNFTILGLSSTATTGITAGGTFTFNTAGVTGTVTGGNVTMNPAGTSFILITATTGTVTFNASTAIISSANVTNVNMFNYTGACNFTMSCVSLRCNVSVGNPAYGLYKSSAGVLTFSGDVYGGNNNNNQHGMYITQGVVNIIGSVYCVAAKGITQLSGTLNITGNVTGSTSGGGANATGLDITSTNCTIVGNLYGSNTAGSTSWVAVATNANCIVNVTGNCIGGLTSPAIGLNNATSTINVTGNVTGGSQVVGVNVNAGNLNITGVITGGTAATAGGASTSGTGTLNHIGTAQASAFGSALVGGAPTANLIATGPFLRNGYIVAVASQSLKINSAYNPYFEFRKSDATNVTYVDQSTLNFPAVGNVRLGTTYASGLYTGTLNVPTPAQVLAGIPVDNTVGTLLMSPSDFWNYLIASGFTAGSIGERLQNSSTVATTGAQIAAYNI
jgi:hypothetical protein